LKIYRKTATTTSVKLLSKPRTEIAISIIHLSHATIAEVRIGIVHERIRSRLARVKS